MLRIFDTSGGGGTRREFLRIGTAALGMGLQGLAAVNLGFVILWLGLTYLLVRKHQQVERDPSADPAASAEAVELENEAA